MHRSSPVSKSNTSVYVRKKKKASQCLRIQSILDHPDQYQLTQSYALDSFAHTSGQASVAAALTTTAASSLSSLPSPKARRIAIVSRISSFNDRPGRGSNTSARPLRERRLDVEVVDEHEIQDVVSDAYVPDWEETS